MSVNRNDIVYVYVIFSLQFCLKSSLQVGQPLRLTTKNFVSKLNCDLNAKDLMRQYEPRN